MQHEGKQLLQFCRFIVINSKFFLVKQQSWILPRNVSNLHRTAILILVQAQVYVMKLE